MYSNETDGNFSGTGAGNFVLLATLEYRNIVTVWTTFSEPEVKNEAAVPCAGRPETSCDPVLQAVYYLSLYGTYLAYVIGIPGSFLTCLVLTRMRPFNSSLVWFTAINVTGLFNLSMRFGLSVQLIFINIEDWSCKFLYLMAPISEYSTHLFLVGLTVERFIAVWFPLKMAVWCSIRRTVCAIVIITIICVGQSIYVIEVYRLNALGLCVLRAKYADFWESIYEMVIITTEFILIPILVIIVLNILIANRIKRAKLLHQRNLTDAQSSDKVRQHSQINRMLTAASITSIVFLAPEIFNRYSVGPLLTLEGVIDGHTLRRALAALSNVCSCFKVYKYAANFIVYSLAAQKFRMGIVRLLTCDKYGGGVKRGGKLTKKHTNWAIK
ncbi:unnamed protein product [Lymnaea stagnalis]|uniref:G-protein coupled receptors family 1 profile domain-containing protein n=1 Tax=Lymnaea stagnalis TaxID=6523 RepID=A0AAV2HXP1_LYMST